MEASLVGLTEEAGGGCVASRRCCTPGGRDGVG